MSLNLPHAGANESWSDISMPDNSGKDDSLSWHLRQLNIPWADIGMQRNMHFFTCLTPRQM